MSAQATHRRSALRTLARYSAFTSTAFRQSLAERGAILGRVCFMAVILLVFSRLWLLIADRTPELGLDAPDLVWYLAVTEWIVLALPAVHLDIEADVRSGDIAVQLTRPVSYVGMRFASGLGEFLARSLSLALAGLLLASGLAGGLPADPSGLLLAVPLGLLAGALACLFLVWIGLLAFWLQEVGPLYWIWQKLAFVLGGLLFPLVIYPAWLQRAADLTPFPSLLYGPASMTLGFDPEHAAGVAVRLVLWTAALGLLVGWTYRRALRVMDINGG